MNEDPSPDKRRPPDDAAAHGRWDSEIRIPEDPWKTYPKEEEDWARIPWRPPREELGEFDEEVGLLDLDAPLSRERESR